jgi:hypothetical protein
MLGDELVGCLQFCDLLASQISVGFQNSATASEQRLGCGFVLVDQAAEDRSTPDCPVDRFGDRHFREHSRRLTYVRAGDEFVSAVESVVPGDQTASRPLSVGLSVGQGSLACRGIPTLVAITDSGRSTSRCRRKKEHEMTSSLLDRAVTGNRPLLLDDAEDVADAAAVLAAQWPCVKS